MDDINKKPTCTQICFSAPGHFLARWAPEKKCVPSPPIFCCAHPNEEGPRSVGPKQARVAQITISALSPPGAHFPKTLGIPPSDTWGTQRTHARHSMDTPLHKDVHPWRGQQSKTCPWRTVVAYGSNRIKRLQEENKNTWKLLKDNKNSQDDVSECLPNKYSQGGCTNARWQMTEARERRKR